MNRPDIEGIERRLKATRGEMWTFKPYDGCGENLDAPCDAGDIINDEEVCDEDGNLLGHKLISYDMLAEDAQFVTLAKNQDVADLLAWIRHLETNWGVIGMLHDFP